MSRNQAKDKQRLIEQLRKLPIVEAACHNVSLPRATYYRWRKDDTDFAQACDDAIEQSAAKINDLAESQLINAIKDKNMSAIVFWLKHHHRAYESRLRLDGKVGIDTGELSADQAVTVERALRLAGMLGAGDGYEQP